MFVGSVTGALLSVTGLMEAAWPQVRIWAVFILCLFFSAVGVALSFIVLGSVVTGVRLWGVGLIIAIIMLGISYGAKYANDQARINFTPVDLIQYVGQGFLWPSTWPALASFLGVQVISPPKGTAEAVEHLTRILGLS